MSSLYRTATTAYPCLIPHLGDSAGAGRIRLTRGYKSSKILDHSKIRAFFFFAPHPKSVPRQNPRPQGSRPSAPPHGLTRRSETGITELFINRHFMNKVINNFVHNFYNILISNRSNAHLKTGFHPLSAHNRPLQRGYFHCKSKRNPKKSGRTAQTGRSNKPIGESGKTEKTGPSVQAEQISRPTKRCVRSSQSSKPSAPTKKGGTDTVPPGY